ncbi:ArnT family glycosyltransferase [Methylovorus glucosotrophus]|uniref:ArnT family glycosyltransferase n=1 Tax=Methylovorus glucosotrophus TaxID=266009 RepID=UPI0013313A3D|nr:glycosyltransferase family 39 protein [Methylovorus glucosotrophus]
MFKFFIYHYLILMVAIMSFWGIGHLVARSSSAIGDLGSIRHPIQISLGLGAVICLIQLISILGLLNFTALAMIIAVGIVISSVILFSYFQDKNQRQTFFEGCKSLGKSRKIYIFSLVLCVLPTLLKPLHSPSAWDEVMYHLPHAQQWIMAGKLTVNEWIRYPWFPYNYELLYAAGMILVDDIFPHLLHALAGWLTAVLIYQVAKRYFDSFVAVLSVLIWLQISRSYFGNAYIDMGLTLFIVAAVISFYSWSENPKNNALLYVAAFFMGLAAGTKYQALMFLPIFFVLLVVKRVKVEVFLKLTLLLLIPCAYWYFRNFVITGDPFSPMGGKIFGFYDWNAEDFRSQFIELSTVKGWPHWLLWAAPFCLLNGKVYSERFIRSLVIFCVYSVAVWMIISHYPRYLLPLYPLLAVFSAVAVVYISQFLLVEVIKRMNNGVYIETEKVRKLSLAISSTVLIAFMVVGLVATNSSLKSVTWNETVREKFLNKRIPGYEAIEFQNKYAKGNTYQFGMEYAVYYMKNQTWGDHFGPGRYRDFVDLSSSDLHDKLVSMGFENLMINQDVFKSISLKEDFACYFSEMYKSDPVVLYKIKSSREC